MLCQWPPQEEPSEAGALLQERQPGAHSAAAWDSGHAFQGSFLKADLAPIASAVLRGVSLFFSNPEGVSRRTTRPRYPQSS